MYHRLFGSGLKFPDANNGKKKCNMSDYFPYKEIQGLEDALENVLFSVLTLSFRVDLTHL